MGHFLILIVLMVIVSIRTWSYPLDGDAIGGAGARRNSSVCSYKDNLYGDGDVIDVDEPCLACRCKKGALTCGLRICGDVPEPPPPGCYIVHNAKQCCPQMLCDTETKESDIEVRTISGPQSNAEVCVINGSLYAEGSSLESPNHCEYCYCIGGQQKCIRPRCSMPFEGCKPIYSRNSCCPTQYDCRDQATNVSKVQERNVGCEMGGVRYAEGEMLPPDGSNCQNCYCMKGEVRCIPVTCETEFNGDCEPVYKPGQCCPTSYICSKVVLGISENAIRSLSKRLDVTEEKNEIEGEGIDDVQDAEGRTVTTALDAVNATEPIPTTNAPEETLTESTTFATADAEEMKSRADDPENGTEVSFQRKSVQETTPEVTTLETEESTMTPRPVPAREEFADVVSRNHVKFLTQNKTGTLGESTTLPPILEGIFSGSSQTDDEYDSYDYNEPRLPPSLPNLIIFPFVAADAVVKDEEATKTVNYDESSIKRAGTEPVFYKDYFSPPTKTEGGFIPKEPPALTDAYQESPYLGKDGGYSSVQRPDILITVPPKTNPDQCVSKGHLYEHGELLSEPGDCQSCICYYGDVICQEIVCPPLRQGCRRTLEKDPKSCCGKVVCSTKEPEDHPPRLEYLQTTMQTTKKPITIADVIEVTPDPFRDVIHTEPAPDLPSLMGDLLPVYAEQQTKKPVTVTYKNLVVDYYPDFLVTTTRDDVRKKNYKNPVFYTTEIYPFTAVSDNPNSTADQSANVTYPIQPTVTSSISSSTDDLEGNNSKYPYGRIELVRTSIRPIITVATEPSRLFEYYTIEEYKATPKQSVTRRTRPPNRPRPVKKTTTEPPTHPAKEDQYTTPTKASNPVKHKHSTKTKSKPSSTTQKVSQTRPPVEKNAVEDSFSLDSVLRFFFDTDTTTASPPSTTRKTTKKDGVKKLTTTPLEERPRQTTRGTTPAFEYKERVRVGDDSMRRHTPDQSNKKSAIGGLLKLAGCNIYGRMYRVGKIISELSNPCLECVCTDFGVECNPLLC